MRPVEMDHIRMLAGGCAAELGLHDPAVKSARFSSWAPTGLRPRLARRRPALYVDSRFGELDAAEQEAAIARALVSAAASPRYWRHMALAAGASSTRPLNSIAGSHSRASILSGCTPPIRGNGWRAWIASERPAPSPFRPDASSTATISASPASRTHGPCPRRPPIRPVLAATTCGTRRTTSRPRA